MREVYLAVDRFLHIKPLIAFLTPISANSYRHLSMSSEDHM